MGRLPLRADDFIAATPLRPSTPRISRQRLDREDATRGTCILDMLDRFDAAAKDRAEARSRL